VTPKQRHVFCTMAEWQLCDAPDQAPASRHTVHLGDPLYADQFLLG